MRKDVWRRDLQGKEGAILSRSQLGKDLLLGGECCGSRAKRLPLVAGPRTADVLPPTARAVSCVVR